MTLSAAGKITISESLPHEASVLTDLVHAAYRRAKGKSSWTNEDKLVTGIRTTVEEVTQLITDADKAILKAEVDGVLTGCVLVENHGDGQGYIGMLSVDPDAQSAGLGRTLLGAAEKYVQDVFGCNRATMWILNGRDELLAWYNRCGYELTGETEPFPGQECGAIPLVENLHFLVISKNLSAK